MRDATTDHDAGSSDGPQDPPPRRPVWPETLEADANFPGLAEISDDEFLTRAEAERREDSIAAELSRRELELERRERILSEQAAALESDQRSQRLAEQRFEERTRARESKTNAIQAEFASRLDRCEELIVDLEREEAALHDERGVLQSQLTIVRETVLDELAVERQRFDTERVAFQAEKKEFRHRLESREAELSTTRNGLRASWESERETLRSQLTAKLALELAEERREFEAERFRWEAEREREQAILDEERAKHEQLLTQAQSGLDGIRQSQEREFQERRGLLEAEIAAQVEALEARLGEQQSGWETTRAGAESELLALREELETQRLEQDEALAAARAQFEEFREIQLRRLEEESHARLTAFEEQRAAWIAERDAAQARLDAETAALEELQQSFIEEVEQRQPALDAERNQRRAEIERELTSQREDFEKECESIRRALDEERAMMENRLHFQSDHLGRTRDGLEEARREVDLRLQQAHAQSVRLAETNRLRGRQLDRYRELLDQKEQSLERERRLLAEMHKQVEADRVQDAERREREQQASLAGRDAENLAEKELRDELISRSKQLAERQARLDTLRVEIESTHRENLEIRVALDEAWARLSQTAGPETARKELQVSREIVADYFRKREVEIDRRRELLTTESAVARKQLELAEARRRELTDWLAGSLKTLNRREEDLHCWSSALDARDSRARGFTDRWRGEKLEAEQIIRGLLEQLSEATNDAPRLTLDPTVSLPVEPRRAAG